ncbi:hypothetical protein AURDEDRAFT_181952, partial [Auricularia subglabra TFB-10046 SS5]
MAHLLADETLADILTRHLHVTAEDFESKDPYAVANDSGWCSSSHVLLVCKRWLRVATPLLYDVIILRSSAQAQSLASALKKTPQLGAFVRKVRLEGGFGANVQKFLAHAPNVTDLALNLTLWSNDSSTGICKALPSMNPRNVVLLHLGTEDRRLHARDQENKNEANLRVALEAALTLWTKLTRITLEDSRLCGTGHYPAVVSFMLAVPNLREVHLHITWHDESRYASVLALAKQAHVLRIVLRTVKGDYSHGSGSPQDILEHVCKADPKAAGKIFIQTDANKNETAPDSFELRRQFAIEVPKRIGKPRHADFVPLQNATSEVQEQIWTLILGDAVHDEFHSFRKPEMRYFFEISGSFVGDFVDDNRTVRYAANYMRVCKRFLRIVQQLACPRLQLKSPTAVVQAAALLRKDPTLPPLVETIQLNVDSFTSSDFYGPSTAAVLAELLFILSSATRLREITTSCRLPPDAWQALSAATVTKISTSCYRYDQGPLLAADTFAPFHALQTLDWSDARTEFAAGAAPQGELPQLQTLILRDQTDSFLETLARTRLPALRRLECHGTRNHGYALERLFEAHGGKITEVYIAEETPYFMFRLCPNLTRLELHHADPRMVDGKHDRLATITVGARFMGTDTSEWKKFFEGFALSVFPALREFHIREPDIEKWPTDAHAILKNPWTAWGEQMLAHGVQLVHHRAGLWKPRLKTVKPKRNS